MTAIVSSCVTCVRSRFTRTSCKRSWGRSAPTVVLSWRPTAPSPHPTAPGRHLRSQCCSMTRRLRPSPTSTARPPHRCAHVGDQALVVSKWLTFELTFVESVYSTIHYVWRVVKTFQWFVETEERHSLLFRLFSAGWCRGISLSSLRVSRPQGLRKISR